jgi:uncharacterized protein (TIGR03000 family)
MRSHCLLFACLFFPVLTWVGSPILGEERAQPSSTCQITFYIPPFAKLFVQGQDQAARGSAHRLTSPPLEPGKIYHYNVAAVWKENGSEKRIERRVPIQAGQKRLVNLCGKSLREISSAVVSETNRERKLAGCEPLVFNSKLASAAQKHADNMAKQRVLNHTLDNQDFMERAAAEGYLFSAGGENIAEGAFSSFDVVGMWMRSPGHKKNMLSTDYSEIGVGTAWDTQGRRYDVQVFGRPPAESLNP